MFRILGGKKNTFDNNFCMDIIRDAQKFRPLKIFSQKWPKRAFLVFG